MRALIIDDEKDASLALAELLERYCPDVEVLGFASSYNDALQQLKGGAGKNYDIIFCDIDLGDATGFDILDILKNENGFNGFVVIVSGHRGFALKAFEYDVVHYLTKPVSPKQLMETIARLQKRTTLTKPGTPEKSNLSPETISIYQNGKWKLLALKDVICISSHHNYSQIYLKEERKPYVSSNGLRYYVDKLSTCSQFVRVHKSHIVNRYHITSIFKKEGMLELYGGIEIPLSRKAYRDSIIELMKAIS